MRTLSEKNDVSKLSRVSQHLDDLGVDICSIQECRQRGTGSCTEGNFEFYWSGYKRFPNGRAQAGVMIAVRINPNLEIIAPNFINHRLMSLDALVNGLLIKFIAAYSPTEDGKETEKDQFYSNLRKEVKSVTGKQKWQILGDFNFSSTAVRHYATYFRGQELPGVKQSDNGHRLHCFLAETKGRVANTFFSKKPVRSYTWYSNDKVTKKIIDLNINCPFLQKQCTDCRVYKNVDFDSDHRIVVSKFRFLKKRKNKRNSKPAKRDKKYNFKAITDENRGNFLEKLDSGNFDSAENIISSIKTAADESFPKVGKNRKFSYPWNDDMVLQVLLDERQKHFEQNNKSEYRKLTKKVRKRVGVLKNEHFKSEAERFTEAFTRKEIETAYKTAKEQITTRRKPTRKIKILGLFEHFKGHFTRTTEAPTPEILTQKPIPPPKIKIEINSLPPGIDEVKGVIRKLKNNKASLDIPAEVFKIAVESPGFANAISVFYQSIWLDGEVPDLFGHSEINALWKGKGVYTQPKYWRGIMLSSILTKILCVIIIDRIAEAYNMNLSEGQMGFRQGRGCQDGQYCLKTIHQWCRKSQRWVYVSMVDLSAAFDWCNRVWVFESMRHVIGESKLIDILENMYGKTVAWLKDEVARFESTCGVRQGGTESPIAYNCLAQIALDSFEKRCRDAGLEDFKIPFSIPKNASDTGKIEKGETIINYLGYADDLAIFAFDLDTLERKTRILWDIFVEFDLCMNLDKTETLIYNWELEKIPVKPRIPYVLYPDSIISIINATGEQINIKNSTKFRYLGAISQVDDSSIGDEELNHRITSGVCKFFEMIEFFKNRKINLKTRIQFLNSLVRTRMCYLCGGWTITQAQINKIQSKYTEFLRYMIKGGHQRSLPIEYQTKKGDKREFTKFTIKNEEILKIAKTDTIEAYISRQQSNWIGHCVRSKDSCYIKQLTFPDYYKSDKKKPGILNTTYRSVLLKYKKENDNNGKTSTELESDMITKFKKKESLHEATSP